MLEGSEIGVGIFANFASAENLAGERIFLSDRCLWK
jgi:hypothetical protein